MKIRIRRLNYALFPAIPLWVGMAIPLAHAESVSAVSYTVVAENSGEALFCSSSLPCMTSSGPSSATVTFLVPPSGYPDDPDGSPYSGSASAAVSGSPSPSLAVGAAAAAVQVIPAGLEYDMFTMAASASLDYYFELTQIAGPASSDAVPVLMDGSSSLFSQLGGTDDTTGSSASMQVAAADGSATLYTLPGANDGGFTQVLGILPDVEYEVMMHASASVQIFASEDTDPNLAASASIDPTFTISPDYAADYQLNFSDSIGDVAGTTPEPATWAMMLTGFAGLGAAVRFRRRIS